MWWSRPRRPKSETTLRRWLLWRALKYFGISSPAVVIGLVLMWLGIDPAWYRGFYESSDEERTRLVVEGVRKFVRDRQEGAWREEAPARVRRGDDDSPSFVDDPRRRDPRDRDPFEEPRRLRDDDPRLANRPADGRNGGRPGEYRLPGSSLTPPRDRAGDGRSERDRGREPNRDPDPFRR
jgi:hypothetical protein